MDLKWADRKQTWVLCVFVKDCHASLGDSMLTTAHNEYQSADHTINRSTASSRGWALLCFRPPCLSPPLPPSLPVRVTPPFCMRAAPVLPLPLVRQMVPCRPFLSASKWLQTESTSPSGRRFSSAAAAPISRTRNFCRCCFYAQVPNLEKEPSVPRLPLRCQL